MTEYIKKINSRLFYAQVINIRNTSRKLFFEIKTDSNALLDMYYELHTTL